MKAKSMMIAAALLCASGTALFAAGQQAGSASGGKPVALTMYLPGPGPQAGEEAVEKALAEYTVPRINASMDVSFVGWGEWFDKKKLMIASGEEFDLGFTADWNDFADEVARNAWLPLNDLLDKEAPALKKVVGDFLKGPTVNGKIYAISTVKEKADGGQFLFNERFAKKYNIPISSIKSLKDAEPWLAKIRAGEPRSVAPWFMDPGNTGLVNVAFTYYEQPYPNYFLGKDGKIRHKYNMDLTWDSLKLSHEWFKKGYYQENLEDMLLKKAGVAELKKGDWVFYHHTAHPGKAGEMTGANGFPIVAGGPYQQPVVKQIMLLGSMFGISRTSKNPVQAIKMLELMNTDKYVNNLINFGIEGKHWTFVDKPKGIIKTVANSGYEPNMTWALQNQFMNYLRDFEDPDKWAKYEKFNASAKLGDAVGFFPDVAPVKTQLAALQNALEMYTDILDAGIIDPATAKDDVQKRLRDAGVLEVEAELQKQFDAFKKK